MNSNIKIPEKRQPNTSEIWDRLLLSSNTLKLHMMTLTGERPINCLSCEQSFSPAQTFTQNMTTPTGKQAYECATCGKSFSKNAGLKLHANTHTNDRFFNCPVCAKSFACSSNLKRHIKTHNQKHPYWNDRRSRRVFLCFHSAIFQLTNAKFQTSAYNSRTVGSSYMKF